MRDIDNFIHNYTEADKHKIEFLWNHHDGEHWQDLNAVFRDSLSEQILSATISAPDILLKDIFRAEAVFSREIQAESEHVSALGCLLLKQTKETFIEDYFLAKEESFDTQCAVSLGDVEKELLEEIIANLKKGHIQCTQGEFEIKDVIEFIEDYIDQ